MNPADNQEDRAAPYIPEPWLLALEKFPGRVFIANPEGKFLWANQKFRNAIRTSLSEIFTGNPGPLLQGRTDPRLIRDINRLLSLAQSFDWNLELNPGSESPISIRMRFDPVFASDGHRNVSLISPPRASYTGHLGKLAHIARMGDPGEGFHTSVSSVVLVARPA